MKALISLIVILQLSFSILAQISVESTLKFLALGDSYTIGESVSENQRWPNQLFDKLTNRGVVGSKPVIIAQTGWRTDQLKNAILNSGLQDTFNLVSVLIGVNNQYQGRALSQYYQEFPEILNLAIEKAGGDTSKVFVVSIPDYAFTPFGQNQNPSKISNELDIYNRINDSISNAFGITYFNITPISRDGLNDPSLVANDGLHPSGKQYGLWVDLINASIMVNSSSTGMIEKVKTLNDVFGINGNQIILQSADSQFSNHDTLLLFDVSGKQIKSWNNLKSEDFPINLNDLPTGYYVLSLSGFQSMKFTKP